MERFQALFEHRIVTVVFDDEASKRMFVKELLKVLKESGRPSLYLLSEADADLLGLLRESGFDGLVLLRVKNNLRAFLARAFSVAKQGSVVILDSAFSVIHLARRLGEGYRILNSLLALANQLLKDSVIILFTKSVDFGRRKRRRFPRGYYGRRALKFWSDRILFVCSEGDRLRIELIE